MNSLTAIYFPETLADNTVSVALLTVFAELFFYQALEDDPDFKPDNLFAEKLCGLRVPAPIGAGRDNFLRFINDVNGHESEYYGGWLSHLSFGLGRDKDEASVWALISALQGGNAGETAQRERQENILGQARLVLKLAAVLQRQDAEISRGLQSAAEHNKALLCSLKGDDVCADIGMSASVEASLAPRQINTKHLLAAWGQMYLRDNPVVYLAAATASMSAAHEVFDIYEATAGQSPREICTLAVPKLAGGDLAVVVQSLQEFTRRNAADIGLIRDLLRRSREAGPADITALIDELSLVAANYQQNMNNEDGHADSQIIFYLLPDTDLATIIKRFSVVTLDSPPVDTAPNALIAVLQKK